jgi:hypothetical protein
VPTPIDFLKIPAQYSGTAAELCCCYTDKKENKMFLIYKEIQMGSGANSYMRKGFLIYEEKHKY